MSGYFHEIFINKQLLSNGVSHSTKWEETSLALEIENPGLIADVGHETMCQLNPKFQFFSLWVSWNCSKDWENTNGSPELERITFQMSGIKGKHKHIIWCPIYKELHLECYSCSLFYEASLCRFTFLSIVMVSETKKALNIRGASKVLWHFYLRITVHAWVKPYSYFI